MKRINTILIIIGGALNILGAIFHFGLWYILDWGNTLSNLSIINRNVMFMLNYCLAVFFLIPGMSLIIYRHEILSSKPGKVILFTLVVVYLVRVILEFMLPESNIVTGGILLIFIACHLIPMITSGNSTEDEGFSFH